MTNNQTSKRGGKREGSGRTPDYLQKCKLLAIQASLLCSEATARRQLRDNGGEINGLVTGTVFEALTDWERMTEFDQGFFYGHLTTQVAANRKAGWGVRL